MSEITTDALIGCPHVVIVFSEDGLTVLEFHPSKFPTPADCQRAAHHAAETYVGRPGVTKILVCARYRRMASTLDD